MLRNKVAIIGAGMSKFGSFPDKSVDELCIEAFEDMHLNEIKDDIQALYLSNFASDYFISQGHLAPIVTRALQLNSIPSTTVEGACASGALAVIQGILSIAAGMHDIVLICGVEKMSGMNSVDTTKGVALAAFPEERYIQYTFPQIFAKITMNYFNEYGYKYSDLQDVVIASHNKSVSNEKAQFNFTIREKMNAKGLSIEAYEKDFLTNDIYNPIVAEPLRRYDCAPVSDGAACIVLVNSKLAYQYTDCPIFIRGFGQGSGKETLLTNGEITSFSATKLAAEKAYEMAGVTPSDIDLAEIHDGFSIAGVLQMEDLGLAKVGYGLPTLRESNFVNMSGGIKCKGHPMGATGVAQIYDVSKRLWSNGFSLGMSQNFGGTGSTSAVTVLERK